MNRSNQDETHKRDAAKFVADVPEDQVFTYRQWGKLRNLKDLGNALANVDNSCGGDWALERQALSEWVRDAIGDTKLAHDLESTTSRTHGAWEVANRMAYLTRRIQ